ncbi:MAG: hypothetical protein SAK29_24620, partial [Scytonema sp. PMC 1069.18]|nr:hypothetical protein [Scytonema sp. PMC 1069.18]
DLLEGMLKKLFGNQIPKAEFERILPELKQKILDDMPDFSDDDDEEEDELDELDLDFLFRDLPPKKRKSRKKRGFQELL